MAGRQRHIVALGALVAIAVITVLWWVLALWPVGDAAPEWVSRTRAVCFGTLENGLPDPEGWAVLIGQPLVMLGLLLIGWGREVAAGLRGLARSGSGRVVLAAAGVLAILGAGATGARVRVAMAALREWASTTADVPAAFRALDRPAPALDLVDQHGALVSLEAYGGRPLLVTFVFGHCETICPLVVRETLAARRRLEAAGIPAAATVITLDPWRDTPARLGYLASKFGMGREEWLLGGDVEVVEDALDRWEVPRDRDRGSGDVVHPPLVYVVDPEGRIAFATAGGEDLLVDLVGRVGGGSLVR